MDTSGYRQGFSILASSSSGPFPRFQYCILKHCKSEEWARGRDYLRVPKLKLMHAFSYIAASHHVESRVRRYNITSQSHFSLLRASSGIGGNWNISDGPEVVAVVTLIKELVSPVRCSRILACSSLLALLSAALRERWLARSLLLLREVCSR